MRLIRSKIDLSLFGLISILIFPMFAKAEDYAPFPYYDLEVPIGSVSMVSDLVDYIDIIYRFSISIIGIVSVTMIMYGGLKWVLAAGNQNKIGEAKETITAAVIGLVLALCSYLILYTINPALVELKSLSLAKIEVSDDEIEIETSAVGSVCETDEDCEGSCTYFGVGTESSDICRCYKLKDGEKACVNPSIRDLPSGNVCYINENCASGLCDEDNICRINWGDDCSQTYECLMKEGGKCLGGICTTGEEGDNGICSSDENCKADFFCCTENRNNAGLCSSKEKCTVKKSAGEPCEGPGNSNDNDVCKSGDCDYKLMSLDVCR